MQIIEKLIGEISPKWALQREVSRKKLDSVRAYSGASVATRMSGWQAGGASANTEIAPALFRLIYRSRDLIRNEPLAAKAKNVIVSRGIGKGIKPNSNGKTKRAKLLDELWTGSGDNGWCKYSDHDELTTVYGQMALAFATVFESGSCFIKKNRKNRRHRVPLSIEILEPDFLDFTLDQKVLQSGNVIKKGIEFDENNQRVAYWLWQSHPGEQSIFDLKSLKSIRIPADEIKHVFLRTRPGQDHGIPWLHVVSLLMKDFGDFKDAHLVRQKIAACFAGFVRDMEISDTENMKLEYDKIMPGRIEKLPPGKTIEFASPPILDNAEGYERDRKREIAAGVGISYESLTNDYSQVNFSSGRMGLQDMDMLIDQLQDFLVIPLICETIWDWFEEACEIGGFVPAGDAVGASWTTPKRPFIQPVEESDAIKNQVRMGAVLPSQMVRMLGNDPDTHFEKYAQDLEKLDKLGISLDCDPRKNIKSGQIQQNIQQEGK